MNQKDFIISMHHACADFALTILRDSAFNGREYCEIFPQFIAGLIGAIGKLRPESLSSKKYLELHDAIKALGYGEDCPSCDGISLNGCKACGDLGLVVPGSDFYGKKIKGVENVWRTCR